MSYVAINLAQISAAPGFVHNIDSAFARVGDVELCYYGLAYTVGFLGIFAWLRWRQRDVGWNIAEVYDFSLLFAVCVLLFGRLFAVVVYHWDYYRDHPSQFFSYWRGGMATHGVLLGGLLAMILFCWWRRKSFLRLADEIVIPAAFLMAVGRIGNFINGQIVGTPTDVWWGVEFPNVEGFRHPVTLYEAAKNLAVIPILLVVRRRFGTGRGFVAAHFVFWYGLLRIFTDLFRDHGAELFGIGRNQYFNLLMAIAGIVLMVVFSRRGQGNSNGEHVAGAADDDSSGSRARDELAGPESWFAFCFRRIVFVAILLFSLVVRGAWTPEVLQQRRKEARLIEPDLSEIAELPPYVEFRSRASHVAS